MKLHGQFEKDTEAVKTKESWDWLRCGDLKRETEALIMAAQEQALNTNSIKKNIYKITDSDKCRLYGKNTESASSVHVRSWHRRSTNADKTKCALISIGHTFW